MTETTPSSSKGRAPTPALEPVAPAVVKSTAWMAGLRLALRLIGVINTLVLARLLVPEDFGLVAVGVAVMHLLQNVTDIGVAQSVVRFRHADRRHLDTLFTLSLIRGGVVAGLLLVVASFAGNSFGDDRVQGIFVALAGLAFIQALHNPRFYEFERDQDFSKEFLVSIIEKGVAVIVSIAVAVHTRSYWAIVLGLGAGFVAKSLLMYGLKPYRPRVSLARLGEMWGFTGWVTGVSVVVALNNKLDPLLLGRFLGLAPAGLYQVGGQLSAMPSMEVAAPVARALYPSLSRLDTDPIRMREAYLSGAMVLAGIALPAGVGAAFAASDGVRLFLGPQWLEIIPLIQVLAPVYGLMAVFFATQSFALALGRPRTVFVRDCIALTIGKPILIWAALTHGLMGAAYAAAFHGLLYTGLQAWLYYRLTARSPVEPLWRARRSFLSVIVMSLSLFGWVTVVLPTFGPAPLVSLFSIILVGGGAYALSHGILWYAEGRPMGVERLVLNALPIKGVA